MPSTITVHGHRKTPSNDSLMGVPRTPKKFENKSNIQSDINSNNNSDHLSITNHPVYDRTSTQIHLNTNTK